MANGTTATHSPAAGERAPEGMAGLAKGLAIVEAFGSSHKRLTVAEAANITGISRASARRCLLTLVETGYLIRIGPLFRPTPRMLRLGAAYYESAPLPLLAEPHLDAARNETGESVSLAILEEGYAVIVARAEAERIISSLANIGGRLPAYASATGRVLLAAQSDNAIQAYLQDAQLNALTPNTITKKPKLMDRIQNVRRNKFEITSDELEEGMVSMAIPVTDNSSQIVAAMSMSASSARISTEHMRQHFVPILQRHALALSQSL